MRSALGGGALLALALCGPFPRLEAQTPTKGDSRRITAADIEAHHDVTTALDAVRKIRPMFLRLPTGVGPASSEGRDMVINRTGRKERSLFVNDVLQEKLDDLREIRADQVESMELLSPVEATLRYGEGHPFGIVAVTLKRPRP